MKDIGTIKIHCFSGALSPITHMMETAGNESIINKEYVYHNGIVKMIPVLSGNALRHRIIREPGAMFLVNSLDLKGKLTIDQANYMFYGGTLSESTISENMKTIAKLKEFFPFFRLLGGSLRNQIIGGSLIVLRGILICEENRDVLKRLLPDKFELPQEVLKSSEDFIKHYQYTRGDIQKNKNGSEILSDSDSEVNTNLMIYSGQSIIPGSLFYHGFIAEHISKKEVGALFHSINLWKSSGGTIGGNSRIGHGKLNLSFFMEDSKDFLTGADIDDCVQEYIDHVKENKDNCIQWLNDNFPEKAKK